MALAALRTCWYPWSVPELGNVLVSVVYNAIAGRIDAGGLGPCLRSVLLLEALLKSVACATARGQVVVHGL